VTVPTTIETNRTVVPCRIEQRRPNFPADCFKDLESSVMNLADFRASLEGTAPPPELSLALLALWQDARGDFDAAHELAQRDEGGDGDWVHAYLHRKEGDAGNAAYWYRRAKRPICHAPLDDEWQAIALALLAKTTD
jgi:hypothetical protein